MQTVNVVVRKVRKTRALELFYVNQYTDRPYWWIDGYSSTDGHFQANRDYLRNRTMPVDPETPEAQALIKLWCSMDVAVKARPVSRLIGPRGCTYGGE